MIGRRKFNQSCWAALKSIAWFGDQALGAASNFQASPPTVPYIYYLMSSLQPTTFTIWSTFCGMFLSMLRRFGVLGFLFIISELI